MKPINGDSEHLEQLRGYESESERRYMVEYEYAMYAPYHPDLTDVASFEVSQTQAEDCRRSSASDLESVPCRLSSAFCYRSTHDGRLHIVARSLPERRIALLMRGASPRRRAPAATCCPEPRLCRLQPASERWSTRFT